ncbi:MAG TPA: class I SAM-dependent methyltransferase [Clostridiales bacterium]|nr:class I SAM-dependent methyltransferase [Clostridiales bacterium]
MSSEKCTGDHHHDHNHDDLTLADRERPVCALYENPIFQEITGDSLHPGGPELTRRLIEAAELPSAATVLDVGCGLGATLRMLQSEYGFKVRGIDPSAKLIDQAKAIDPDLPVQLGEADFLEFPSFSFDAVLMECVFSLCEMKEEILHEAYCTLKKGGKLLLSDLYDKKGQATADDNKEADKAGSTPASCLDDLLTETQLIEMLTDSGFVNIRFLDQAQALKDFAAKAILKHGSMETFWKAIADTAEEAQEALTHLTTQAKTAGYYMLVAEKPI